MTCSNYRQTFSFGRPNPAESNAGHEDQLH